MSIRNLSRRPDQRSAQYRALPFCLCGIRTGRRARDGIDVKAIEFSDRFALGTNAPKH